MRAFKYLRLDAISLFENARLKLTIPGTTNDPFDFFPLDESTLTQEEARAWMKDEAKLQQIYNLGNFSMSWENFRKSNHENLEKVAEILRGIFKPCTQEAARTFAGFVGKEYGVLCFTERYDSAVMFAHYANNHEGFMIEVDLSAEPFRSLGPPLSVRYQNERAKFHCNILEEGKRKDETAEALRIKNQDWQYEKELRILVPLSTALF